MLSSYYKSSYESFDLVGESYSSKVFDYGLGEVTFLDCSIK